VECRTPVDWRHPELGAQRFVVESRPRSELRPQNGGCSSCRGVVTIDDSTSPSTITYNVEYYVLGHLGKFVVSGAVRIASNTFGPGSIEDVAFKNPDGSKVLLVLNGSTASSSFTVNWKGENFNYTLPAGALVTFTWK
jgi:glucosylceramidase